jgi:hypothetical protein
MYTSYFALNSRRSKEPPIFEYQPCKIVNQRPEGKTRRKDPKENPSCIILS